VAGHDLLAMNARERLTYRRETVGFLWQQTSRNLFAHLTAAENVALPMRLASHGRRARQRRTGELLDALGVGYCRDRMPAQMSGGEQQRVAIGVALANEPAVLFADEPTGELDTATGEEVFAALRTANNDLGVTILVVTHDQQVSEQVRRTIAIRDGRISTEVLRHTATDEHGQEADVAQEYAVLDRAGRLQIPRDFIETLDMRDRVLLALEPDHVGVWPDAGPGGAAGPVVRRRMHGRHERDSGRPAPDDGQGEA
jgi:ABC-type lipoprotein export system ATPase subunit